MRQLVPWFETCPTRDSSLGGHFSRVLGTVLLLCSTQLNSWKTYLPCACARGSTALDPCKWTAQMTIRSSLPDPCMYTAPQTIIPVICHTYDPKLLHTHVVRNTFSQLTEAVMPPYCSFTATTSNVAKQPPIMFQLRLRGTFGLTTPAMKQVFVVLLQKSFHLLGVASHAKIMLPKLQQYPSSPSPSLTHTASVCLPSLSQYFRHSLAKVTDTERC
jgi:hypothetical protein